MKKITYDIQVGGEIAKPNPIRERYRIKLENLLKIMSKLALIKAYDNQGKIRNKNGEYLEKTNIAQLLGHVMTTNKNMIGEDEFIHLLNEANVPPDWIINENIKKKIKSNREFNFIPSEPQVIVEKIEPRISLKRKYENDDEITEREETENSEYKRPKLNGEGIKWIIPKKKTC